MDDIPSLLIIINTSGFLSNYRICILHKNYIYNNIGTVTTHVPVTYGFSPRVRGGLTESGMVYIQYWDGPGGY